MPGHFWILIILAALALIIFGPRRLPELGEGMGKAIKEFRKATTDMTDSIKSDAARAGEHPATATTYTAVPPTVVAPPLASPPAAAPPVAYTPPATAEPYVQPPPPPEVPRA